MLDINSFLNSPVYRPRLFILLAHKLQRDMTSDSFIEVVQEAVDRTGMDQIPIEDRTRLLSNNGPGYVSRAFRD